MIVPRISTRRHYDLLDGRTLRTDWYHLYPKRSFESILEQKEMVIMIHGLRNDPQGAVKKFVTAKRRLRQLGYDHPVVGFTYDSNTIGAHLKRTQLRALRAGQRIAQKNGRHLARFIMYARDRNPKIRIRLMGHSLGSQVILSAVKSLHFLGAPQIEAVYLFGSSIPADTFGPQRDGRTFEKVVAKKIVNYYGPDDAVLQEAHESKEVTWPLGLHGARGRTTPKYRQHRVRPASHRFASYSRTLCRFP